MTLFYVNGKECKSKKEFTDFVTIIFEGLPQHAAEDLYQNLIGGGVCELKEGVEILELLESLYFMDAVKICSDYMCNAPVEEYEEYERLQESGNVVALARLTLGVASENMLYLGQLICSYDTSEGLFGQSADMTGSNLIGIYTNLDWKQLPHYFERWPRRW
jgi:hypothetical protein